MSPRPSPTLPDRHDVWQSLEQFLEQLAQARDVPRQLRLTLEMVRQSTHADAVVVYSAGSHRVTEWAGPDDLDVASLGEALRGILTDLGPAEAQLLRPQLARPGRPPVSAALVRLSRSRSAWVAAFRLGPTPLGEEDLRLMGLVRQLLLQQQSQQAAQDQLREMLCSMVRCLTTSLDARDPYTWGHSERVARIGVRLAVELELPEAQRSELYLGGLLHDIGKIGVPDEVLRKPGKLTDEEFDQIKQHVLIGDAILAHVRHLAPLRPMVRSHHEQYDGKGYPDGLAGEGIPLSARILAVADSCDAMMSDRPYRKALPTPRIEAILREGAGKQWDPRVIEVFFACRHEAFSICQRGLGDSVLRAVEQALQGPTVAAGAVRTFLGLRPSGQGLAPRPAG